MDIVLGGALAAFLVVLCVGLGLSVRSVVEDVLEADRRRRDRDRDNRQS